MSQNRESEWSSSIVTFQLDIHNFHLPKPSSPTEQIPNQVISTVVSPDSRSRAREWEEGTPGTAAVRIDIQAWLIYGVGEIVPLLWVLVRRRSWQFPPPSLTQTWNGDHKILYIHKMLQMLALLWRQWSLPIKQSNPFCIRTQFITECIHERAVLLLGSDYAWLVDPFHWTSLRLWHDGSLA